jgi:decaprenyl-phosphate phosphoribosyltransferase
VPDVAITGEVAPAGPKSLSFIRLLRPKQWSKNVLVFAAPAAAGVLDNGEDLAKTIIAFAAFCLAASGVYCLNDARDAEADRLHPRKRHRPVAARHLSGASALRLGAVLLVASAGVSLAVDNVALLATVVAYIVLQLSYTFGLKQVAILDLALVASGFIMRALAGAAATEVPVSDWFLIVASFGSLFIVAGKRSAEFADVEDPAEHRAVLFDYPPEFLRSVRSVAAGVTLLAYSLFAFERASLATSDIPWFELSIAPFVLGVLRYALRLDQGDGGAPEDIILGDRSLLVFGAVWAVLFALGIYA